jgi:hypothetical protein
MLTFTKPMVLAEIKGLHQGGSNLQDEYSNNLDLADFLGCSPAVTFSKSQLDGPTYWRRGEFCHRFPYL